MAITLREGLGRKLTIAEMDENFLFLSSSYVVNSITGSMTASFADSSTSASQAEIATLAREGSGSFSGSFEGDGAGLTGVAPIAGTNIDVTGTTVSLQDSITLTSIIATSASFVLQTFESSSTIITSGSNIFGDQQNDTQQITGSLLQTGSYNLSGSLLQSNGIISGSFEGNGSGLTGITADLADSASVAARATTLSPDATASFADLAGNARNADSASEAAHASTASIADLATTLSPDATASFADLAGNTRNADSASVASRATTLSPEATASIADLATTASHAVNTATASHALDIQDNIVTTTKIVDSNVTNAKLQNDNVVLGSTTATLGQTLTSIQGLNLISATTGTFVLQLFDSSSTIITSGSTIFGDEAGDIQQFTGSILQSGSMQVTGSISISNGLNLSNLSEDATEDTVLVLDTNGIVKTKEAAATSGTSGTSGSDGSSGTSGTNGTSGTSGPAGAPGTSGTSGTSGPAGVSGSSGTSGTNGTSGTSGTTSITNASNDRVMTSTGGVGLNAEANLTFNGSTLTVTGTITETSAKRYKKNIVSLNDSLSKVLQLNPVEFDWIRDDKHDVGLIAEEVNEILPSLVQIEEDEIQGIHYSRLTAVLINAIQELTKRVEKLENK